MVLPVNSGCYPGYSMRFYFLGVSSYLVTLHVFGTKLGSLLSISVVLPINSGCYPGYSRRFYFLEFLLTLLPFTSFVWYKTWILLSISVVLPVNSECYPGYSRRFYFLGVSSNLVTLHVFGTRLGSYSVYQWSYLSTVDVTLDTVGDSISLEFLLTLLPFMSLVQDLDLIQYISGLTCQQWMLPWIE